MKRVVVAMSGGVDSSVAAALVHEAGHEAVGVTLKLASGPPTGFGCCGSPRDIDDARRAAGRIGISHYVLDFEEVFERAVVEPFVSEYLSLRTPNPCVDCNRKVKFGVLLRLARAWGAAGVATGHYARVEKAEGPSAPPLSREEDGRAPGTERPCARAPFRLLCGVDEEKDQSYFLSGLTQEELPHLLFPVGAMRKDEVRARARTLGLCTADKPESMDVCFIPGRDHGAFLRARAAQPSGAVKTGAIRDDEGRLLGEHKGLAGFTIGQRKGLGLAGGPWYVSELDGATNTLVVGPEERTHRGEFEVSGIRWVRGEPQGPELQVRIRHRGRLCPARWENLGEGRARVTLAEPQRAVTPGQAAVFYRGEEMMGGGTIASLPRGEGRAL